MQQLRSGLRMWDDRGYPAPELVSKSGLCGLSRDPMLRMRGWPANPFTGKPMHSGTGPGDYDYTPLEGRGRGGEEYGAAAYRLVGYGRDGKVVVVTGDGWDSAVELAIDDIGTAIKSWARAHGGRLPAPAIVDRAGLAGYFKGKWSGGSWPTNPWSGAPLHSGTALGDYQYRLRTGDRGFELTGRGDAGVDLFGVGWSTL